MKVLASGSAGFIGGFFAVGPLGNGYSVVGVDNLSQYGKVAKSYDNHPNYRLVEGDCRDTELMTSLLADCDHFIAGAALIGGISYFHTYAYDLLATNERIIASSCDAAIKAHKEGRLQKVTYMSSSMVFERAEQYPTREAYLDDCPVPLSAYGFSKLTGEVYCRAAHDEHGLPYTICRPFNAYGPGEMPDDEPGIAHAVPDLIRKVLSGQRPLQIFGSGQQTRTLTHVDDIADGIVTAMGAKEALNVAAAVGRGEAHVAVATRAGRP